jgi:penicillin amidase
VEILVDVWGVAHIYASSLEDLFFAQGFNAARERLWQMDLWRRRGLGLLSEVLGDSYLEHDRAARLFLYRGDAEREWEAYGPESALTIASFVRGINEYVRTVEEEEELLPIEFRIMDYRPALWLPEDVVRIRNHVPAHNLRREVARAQTLRDFGPEVEAVRTKLEPPSELRVPEGLDLDVILDDVLRVYELATNSDIWCLQDNGEPGLFPSPPQDSQGAAGGSNNWAVSPARTATGRPILANDPHRSLTLPSLRYAAHLVAPGLDVIGAGEPFVPGISIGHNGEIAFGLTIFLIDQEDLYVYETNPENPSQYRYRGNWEHMEVETQTVEVKGESPVSVELKYTRHGPVIHEDRDKNVAYSVRAAWLEPGAAPYLAGLGCMRAKNWPQFLEAIARWHAPGENFVYADAQGNIGWKPAGLVPVRPNWDGLLPVPGDGRYEWDGFLDPGELPSELNPHRGWIATANQMNLPEDYPYNDKIGFEWMSPFRYMRIAERLDRGERHTLQSSVRLQNDYLSIPARWIVEQLGGLRSEDPKVKGALDLLRSWDCVLSADSAAAALFEVWYRHYLPDSLLARLVPPEALESVLSSGEVANARTALNLVRKPDERLGEEPLRARNHAVLESLAKATRYLENVLGPRMEQWRWGSLHQAHLVHPLAESANNRGYGSMNVGPVPRGGSMDTVGCTSYEESGFLQSGGASWRVVVDVGNWDDSVFINTPGQSGDLGSPNYADLFDEWASDGVFPLLYSRSRVEAATVRTLTLNPVPVSDAEAARPGR